MEMGLGDGRARDETTAPTCLESQLIMCNFSRDDAVHVLGDRWLPSDLRESIAVDICRAVMDHVTRKILSLEEYVAVQCFRRSDYCNTYSNELA